MIPLPPTSKLFPYTTLFRSRFSRGGRIAKGERRRIIPRARGHGRKQREEVSHALRGTSSGPAADRDRKSTRLNSSHSSISYAVFCLKKKNTMPSLNVRIIVL